MTQAAIREKDPDADETYAVDFSEIGVIAAPRETDVVENDIIRSQLETGWIYRCIEGGRTGRHYPIAWPRAEGETLRDGSATWECLHPSSASLPSVQDADWTLPSGLALVSQQEQGLRAIITVSGGTDGEDYDVLCRATLTTGQVIEQTITIPVRSQ